MILWVVRHFSGTSPRLLRAPTLKFTTSIRAVFLVGLTAIGHLAFSDQPITFTILQDEVQELPPDNTGYFSAAREVSVQLDLLAAIEEGLGETFVTVIRPNGEESEVRAGEDGSVVIDNAESGPHALVASNGRAHGSTLLYFKEPPAAQPADPAEPATGPQPLPPVRMTMLAVNREQLRPIVEDIRDVGLDEEITDVPAEVASGGKQFDYRVVLDSDGTLNGRLLSVMKEGAGVNFEGTRIVAFRDGARVGSTMSDASGLWAINDVQPGVHGLIAAGPAGYAAFSFEAVESGGAIVTTNIQGETFTSRMDPDGEQLPVVMVPPAFVPAVVKAIDKCYCLSDPAPPAAAGDPYALPVGGFMVPPTPAPGSGVGGGFAGGGGGGSGFGIGAGVGLAGLAAVIGSSNRNDRRIQILAPPVTSRSVPAN